MLKSGQSYVTAWGKISQDVRRAQHIGKDLDRHVMEKLETKADDESLTMVFWINFDVILNTV